MERSPNSPISEKILGLFFRTRRKAHDAPELSGSGGLSPVPRPLRTVLATFTAHGSSKPGWGLCPRLFVRVLPDFSYLLILCSRFPWLDTHGASISNSSPLHPSSKSVHRPHVSTLSRWVGPYPAGLYSPCLSAAGFGFLRHPVPTEEFAFPCGWVTDYSDLIGVSLFRISEKQQGWEPTVSRGLWYAHES